MNCRFENKKDTKKRFQNGEKEITMEEETVPSTKLILLVDDENFIRNMLRRTLSRLWPGQITFYEAEDGQKALEQAHRQKPDLVITDLMMPQMNGFELLMALDTLFIPPIPAIMISGGSQNPRLFKKVEGLNTIGRITLLDKPFDFEKFRQAITEKLPQLQSPSFFPSS